MKLIGAIFARGGSKGIKQKNLQRIGDISLTKKSIEDLINSKIMDSIYLSSDDQLILDEASEYNKVKTIKRPKSLCMDDSNELDSWKHLLVLENIGHDDILVVTPTTSPLRRVSTIIKAVDLIKKSEDIDGVVCVSDAHRHPQFNLLRKPDSTCDRVELWDSKKVGNSCRLTRRQDAKDACDLTTVVFVYKADYLLKCNNILDGRIYSITVDRTESLDIDTMEDLEYARYIVEQKKYGY